MFNNKLYRYFGLVTVLTILLIVGCEKRSTVARSNKLSTANALKVVDVAHCIIDAANSQDISSVEKQISLKSLCRENIAIISHLPKSEKKAALAKGFPQWGNLKLATQNKGKSSCVRIYLVPSSSLSYRQLCEMILAEPYATSLTKGKFNYRLVVVPVDASGEIRYLAVIEEKSGVWHVVSTPEGFEATILPDLNNIRPMVVNIGNFFKKQTS